ncbi:uncharacterized protein [Polyergus mexicanus]|uniref:uncharacterized protein n=1 Tax=Polyergus mexicanus TaxID=615972 RepID=UPI0038B4A0F3
MGASFHELKVFLGEDKLVRVKTKLVHRNDSVGLRFPILSPGGHPIVSYLIRSIHHRFCHAGVQFKQKRAEATPDALPKDHVKDAMVFETTGVDLCGPLYLRTGEKVWIVLFTCAVYRCVHLELVTSLSAEAFLLALLRFIGRPAAPWWGGFWERLIRSVKDLLKRILGKARLPYTELTTCVIDVEAVINQRPLTYVSEDGEDLVPLTPAMFLREIPEVTVPDFDQLEKNGLRGRYRHLTRVRSMLKERFRKEYLAELVHHGKLPSSRPVRIGDVVLVGSDNRKRLEWPLARVLDLLPGKDGVSRVAGLKLSSGELICPIQRLYLMEGTPTMMEEDDPESTVSKNPEDDRENVSNVTRSGRRVRKSIRFSF